MRNHLRTGDIVVTVIVLILTILVTLYPAFNKPGFAVIYVDGNEYGRYSLSAGNKETVVISTEFGQNTVVIDDGKAYVTQSSCKDKVEVNAGAISEVGQVLVCLPNRVVVTVEGGTKVDATTF